MTQKQMYDALVHAYGYNSSVCRPATRYDEKYRESRETYSVAEKLKEYYSRKDIETMNLNHAQICVDGRIYKAHDIELTENYGEFPKLTASAYLSPSNCTGYYSTHNKSTNHSNTSHKHLTIENVIFNPPATIVFWSDKTKTIVKADYDYESYDPEKGIAMAIAKKLMGDNKGKYYELFKYWRNKWDKQNEGAPDITIPKLKNPFKAILDNLTGTVNYNFGTIQTDGALTRIEDNASLNDLVSKDLKETINV